MGFIKNLREKKQQLDKQLDNLLSLEKAIKNLVVHSKNDFFECYIDSSFHIYNIKYIGSDDIVRNSISDCGLIEDVVNKSIQKMQELIQLKSKEIYNKKKKA